MEKWLLADNFTRLHFDRANAQVTMRYYVSQEMRSIFEVGTDGMIYVVAFVSRIYMEEICGMLRFKNLSVQKKIMLSMLVFTLIPVILVTTVAAINTYKTMRDQLIYDHRMSSGWLQKRLSLEINNMMDQFYEVEVDQDVKTDILRWCTQNQVLDYTAQWRIITMMNTIINMDSKINSIELFNLSNNTVLVAERSGAYLDETGERLDQWKQRDEGLQTNLVFLRTEKEILTFHQIYQFDNKRPIALMVIHLRPYRMQDILDEIKTVPEETILVFNDQNELIEANYGTDWNIDVQDLEIIRKDLAEREQKEASFLDQFWFYRTVNNGKLQILLTVPDKTIVNSLFSTIFSSIAVAFLAIFASIICSVVYSHAISRPIRKLSDEMKTLTLNEYSGTFAEDREDEIGILQDSFDHMISRNKELIAQQYQSKLEKRNAQLRALQAQINPHFMYNTLQVIGGMALDKNAPQIYQITVALSDIMRYSLNFSKEMVCLAEEVQYLKSYIMIQNSRFGEKVCLDLKLAEETLDCQIPKLILQPLVENSFEHGFLNKAGNWKIEVESQLVPENNLLLRVKDNGEGFSKERLQQIRETLEQAAESVLKSGSHIGLVNVHARIRLRCPEKEYGLTIESTPAEGTIISVLISAQKERGEENHA